MEARVKGVRSLRDYMPKALKFHELKNETMTRILFTVMLFVSFAGAFLPDDENMMSAGNVAMLVLNVLVIPLASTIYLVAFLLEQHGREYSVGTCFYILFKRILSVILAYLLYIGAVLGSLYVLSWNEFLIFILLPAIVFYSIYLFLGLCYIIDSGRWALSAFFTVGKRMKGILGKVFSLVLAFNIILAIPSLFMVMPAVSSNNRYIIAFVISFISTVVCFMQQRLYGLIYVDLEYGYDAIKPDDSNTM